MEATSLIVTNEDMIELTVNDSELGFVPASSPAMERLAINSDSIRELPVLSIVSDQRSDIVNISSDLDASRHDERDAIIQHDQTTQWRRELADHSLPEYYGAIGVPTGDNVPWYKILPAFVGPGAMVAVGYMDPGNWSTDIAGGSAYGYKLLFVVLFSSLIAMFLQTLALKAGLATNRDLAQICRDSYHPIVVTFLWIIAEAGIVATDIAEVLGSAIALNLLFQLPLIAGVCLTAVDIIVIMFIGGSKFRYLEIVVAVLVMLIAAVFAAELGLSHPAAIPVVAGFLPSDILVNDKGALFIGLGIIGATVMPHNLYLHSSIVLTRQVPRDVESIKQAVKYGAIDTNVSLLLAFFVNAAILMVSAATFHERGYNSVATLQDAYKLISPLLNSKAASILFGVALLASGQNSTLTGTLTGQIVMEGFMTWTVTPVVRRLITRSLAILPAVIATAVGGAESANYLLILSQVILSFALPFAVVPLAHVTCSESKMGVFVNSLITKVACVIVSFVLIILNIFLLV